jgi:hypothetical protein
MLELDKNVPTISKSTARKAKTKFKYQNKNVSFVFLAKKHIGHMCGGHNQK